MQRYDLRDLHDDFYSRMGELIDSGLKVGEVGIFLFEVGDYSSIQKSADYIRELGHDLMNSLKFNEVDWTIVVKKVDKERKEEEKKAKELAEQKRLQAERIAKERAEAKAKEEAKAKAEAEAKAKEEAKAKVDAETKIEEKNKKAPAKKTNIRKKAITAKKKGK